MDLDLSTLESLRIPAGPNRPAQPIAQEPSPQTDETQTNTRPNQSRINGAKSKGPTTSAGKHESSKSALKHGLTAEKHTVLDIEDPAEFNVHLNIALDQFRPSTLFARQLVEEIANTNWRKTRLKRLETAYLNHQISEELGTTPDPITQAAAEGTDELAALLRTWIAAAHTSGPIELLRRYIATLNHQFNTTLTNLLKLEKRDAQRRHDPNFEAPYQAPEFPAPISQETKRTQETPAAPVRKPVVSAKKRTTNLSKPQNRKETAGKNQL